MTKAENATVTAGIFASTAARLMEATGAPMCGDDVRTALTVALAGQFGETGGVMIVWLDSGGLKVNAAPYGEAPNVAAH